MGAINKGHRVRCSCLAEVSCFILFADIFYGERIHISHIYDTESWVFKLSFQIYIVKSSLGNSLDHISIIQFEPVKQTLFMSVDFTRQSHIVTKFNSSQMNLLRKLKGSSHSWKKAKEQ